MVKLKDKPNHFIAVFVQLAPAHPVQVPPFKPHNPLIGPVKSAEDMQQRALAAARRADYRHKLTFFDRDVGPLQNLHLRRSHPV